MNHLTNKSSVTQTVARQLQEMIRTGTLAKDEKIPSQRILSEQLGVSRTSLREALLTLETLGLVRTYPARGTFVVGTEIQRQRGQDPWRFDEQFSILDVFQSRILIETEICRLTAPCITAEIAQKLKDTTDQFESAWKHGDLVTHVESDLAFHGLIAQTCPNAMLRRLYHSVSDLLTESQRVPIPSTALTRMNVSMQEHRSILEALVNNRGDEAAKAMQSHIRNTAACAGVSI